MLSEYVSGEITATMPHTDGPYHHHLAVSEWLARGTNCAWRPVTRLLGPLCGVLIDWTDRLWLRFMLILLGLTIAVIAWDFVLYADDFRRLDWLWITGYPVALFVLFRSSGLPDRIFYLRQSLVNQDILDIYDPVVSPTPSLDRERVSAQEEAKNARILELLKKRVLPHTAVLTILFCAVANYIIHTIGIYRAVSPDASTIQILNAQVNHVLGHLYILLLGLRLGRAVAFSVLMWAHGLVRLHLSEEADNGVVYRVRLNPQPGHPDGICGLRTILDFWTFEASLLVPPLIYTLAWMLVLNTQACQSGNWAICEPGFYSAVPARVYVGHSLVLIALQVLSLWWPLLALRMHLGLARDIVRTKLDEIVSKTSSLRFQIVNSNDPAVRKDAADQLAHTIEAYQDYQGMPLWPITRETLIKHFAQLWTVLVFIGVVQQEETLSALMNRLFS